MRTTSTMLVGAVSIGLLFAAACGGGGKKANTTPDETAGGGGGEYEGNPCEDPCAGGMCPPETLDAINRALVQKRTAAARCLSDAVNAGKVSKNAHGHVALSFKITPAGKAKDITVVQSSIKSPEVEQCVIGHVASIAFESPPIELDWSHTYAFESM